MKPFITLFFIIVGTIPSFGNSLSCRSLFVARPVFEGCYQAGLCPDNIYHLYKGLKTKHPEENFSDAKVLYIYPRWTGSYRYHLSLTAFKPKRTRFGQSARWNFHVVLLHKGFIYDFDHNAHNEATPLETYAKEMLGAVWITDNGQSQYRESIRHFFDWSADEPSPEPGSQLTLHVRAIPAEIYVAEYSFDRNKKLNSGVKSYAHWVHGDERFPDQTLEEFLVSSSDKPPQ